MTPHPTGRAMSIHAQVTAKNTTNTRKNTQKWTKSNTKHPPPPGTTAWIPFQL